jgi:hypothetical protein
MRPNVSVQEVNSGDTTAGVYAEAYKIIGFGDGSSFALHPYISKDEKNIVAPAEATPILGTMFVSGGGAHARQQAFNFIRREGAGGELLPGDLYPGTTGQFQAAAMFSDGKTFVISLGWNDASGHGQNGIFVAERPQGKAGLIGKHLIRVQGMVSDLMAGPGNLFFALTNMKGPLGVRPTLAVFDTSGRVHGTSFPFPTPRDDGSQLARMINSILLQAGGNRVAVYDSETDKVHFFTFIVPTGLPATPAPGLGASATPKDVDNSRPFDVALTEERSVSVAALPGDLGLIKPSRTTAAHIARDGSVFLVRSIVTEGRKVRTIVCRYDAGGALIGTWFPAAPYRAAYFTGDTLTGVVVQGREETVTLESAVFE